MTFGRMLLAAGAAVMVLAPLTNNAAYAQAFPRGGGEERTRGGRVLPGATGAQQLPVGAEDVPRGETVTTRQRAEVIPLGARVAGFILFPKLSLEESYNDNIFSTESAKQDDFITVVRPEFALRSDWANHAFNVGGDARIGRYADFGAEDYEDINVDADGRFDISRDIYLFGGVGYSQLHEGRGSPDDVRGSEPTEYDVLRGNVRYFHKINRVSFRADAAARKLNFDDVPTSTGALIDNDDRDRTETDLSLRTAYEVVPEYEAFIRGTVNDRSYDHLGTGDNLDRDSHGFEVVAGISMDFGGVTFGNFFVGWAQQYYGDTALEDIGEPLVGADLTWNVTSLTTLHGGILRRIEETTQGGASGFFVTRLGLEADHELLRNLLLNANAAVTHNNYKGIDRDDYIYEGGIGAKYMMNRNFWGSLEYRYRQRERDTAPALGDADYKQNVVTLRLEMQM